MKEKTYKLAHLDRHKLLDRKSLRSSLFSLISSDTLPVKRGQKVAGAASLLAEVRKACRAVLRLEQLGEWPSMVVPEQRCGVKSVSFTTQAFVVAGYKVDLACVKEGVLGHYLRFTLRARRCFCPNLLMPESTGNSLKKL